MISNNDIKDWKKLIQEEDLWKFIIDGSRHYKGPNAFEDTSPGYLKKTTEAFKFMLDAALSRELSFELLEEMYYILTLDSDLKGKNEGWLRDNSQGGSMIWPLQSRYGVRSVSQDGLSNIKMLQDDYPNFFDAGERFLQNEPYITRKENKFISFINESSTDRLEQAVKDVIAEYHEETKNADTEKEKLKNIAYYINLLHRLHPPYDGTTRLLVTLALNMLLIQQGFPPINHFDANLFTGGLDFETLSEYLKRQIEKFKANDCRPVDFSKLSFREIKDFFAQDMFDIKYALYYACVRGDAEIVNKILEEDDFLKNDISATLLNISLLAAIHNGRLETVKILLATEKFDKYKEDYKIFTKEAKNYQQFNIKKHLEEYFSGLIKEQPKELMFSKQNTVVIKEQEPKKNSPRALKFSG